LAQHARGPSVPGRRWRRPNPIVSISRIAGACPAGSQQKRTMITFSRDRDARPPRVWFDRGVGRQEYPVRPKIAMWSDYGSPTQKRWRSRHRRGTRSSIGLRILLVAVASVAGVVGISGVYPQIIDSEWARGMNPHSQGFAHSETAPETVGLTQQTHPPAPRGLNGSLNSSATVRKRQRCPVSARCKTSSDLCLAAMSLLFFERQSNQVQRPSGFAFASNLTHAKAPTFCAPN
jgi:hypothetical protein